MHYRIGKPLAIAAALMILGCGLARAEDKAALDKSFDKLKTYDFGTNRDDMKAIDDAIVSTHGDKAACLELEKRLAAVLSTSDSRDAKDYVLRCLRIVGTAESVPAIAPLLEDKDLSHMARYALELNPSPEAGKALRDALPKVSGPLKIGVIGSLASRHDTESVAAIAASLTDSDKAIAKTAAHALRRDRRRGCRQAIGRLPGKGARRREAGRDRCLSILRREAAQKRQEIGSDRHLQIADGRKRTEARPPRRHPRHVGRARFEKLSGRL